MFTFEQFYKEFLIEAIKGGADFSVISTDHERKRSVIEWENQLIKRAFLVRGEDEAVLGVVGNSDGLKRHVDQWLDLGFQMQNINIVDYQEKTADSLKQKAIEDSAVYNYGDLSNRISQANIFEKAGEIANLTHIDFDGVETISKLSEYAKKLAAINNLKSFVIVVTQRGTTKIDANAAKAQANPLDKGKALYGFSEINPNEFDYEIIQAADKIWKSFNIMKGDKVSSSNTQHELKSKFKRAAMNILFSYSNIAKYYKQLKEELQEYEIAYESYRGNNMPMVSFVFLKGSGIINEKEQEKYAAGGLDQNIARNMFWALEKFIDFLASKANYEQSVKDYKLPELIAYMRSKIRYNDYDAESGITDYLEQKLKELENYIQEKSSTKAIPARIRAERGIYAKVINAMKNLKANETIDLSSKEYFGNTSALPKLSALRSYMWPAEISAVNFIFLTEDGQVGNNGDALIKTITTGTGTTITRFFQTAREGDSLDLSKKPASLSSVSGIISHYARNTRKTHFNFDTIIKDGKELITKITKKSAAEIANMPNLNYKSRDENKTIAMFISQEPVGASMVVEPPMSIPKFNFLINSLRSRGFGRRNDGNRIEPEDAKFWGAGMFKFKFDKDNNIIKISKVKESINQLPANKVRSRTGEVLINLKNLNAYTMQSEKFALCNFKDFFSKTALI